VDAANTAWQKSDLANVVVEADKALAIYPNDAAMKLLKTNAQGKIADQIAYNDAMKKATVFFDNHDFNSAETWAMTALQNKQGDATATKIRDSAQQFLNGFNDMAKQAQTAYQQAQIAYQQGDLTRAITNFTGAITFADKALGIRKDDAAMQNLKTDVRQRLDAILVVLLESFNVSVPSEIKYAEVKKASSLGAIGEAGKPYYRAQAERLEIAYRAGSWLGEGNRQTCINDLRKAIENWE
jgi:tetratricopeptide (TPR) repeat protein